MDAVGLASQLIAEGFKLEVQPMGLACKPAKRLTPKQRDAIRKHRDELWSLANDLAGTLCPTCGKPEIIGRITCVVRCMDPACELTRQSDGTRGETN